MFFFPIQRPENIANQVSLLGPQHIQVYLYLSTYIQIQMRAATGYCSSCYLSICIVSVDYYVNQHYEHISSGYSLHNPPQKVFFASSVLVSIGIYAHKKVINPEVLSLSQKVVGRFDTFLIASPKHEFCLYVELCLSRRKCSPHQPQLQILHLPVKFLPSSAMSVVQSCSSHNFSDSYSLMLKVETKSTFGSKKIV